MAAAIFATTVLAWSARADYTAAQVLAGVQAKMVSANQMNTLPHINTMTRAQNVNVYQVGSGVFAYTSSMAIDTDGSDPDPDPDHQSQTTWTDDSGHYLGAHHVAYYVLGDYCYDKVSPCPHFYYAEHNITGLQFALIFYNGKIEGAVFGDTQGDSTTPTSSNDSRELGEASVEAATLLGIPNSGTTGGVDNGVTVVIFSGSSWVVHGSDSTTINNNAQALIQQALNTLGPQVSGDWTTVNDTDAGITYSSGWTYGGSRGLGDYQNDVHYTAGAGNYAQYTFTGTGVQYITEANTDEGNVDVYIDNVFQTTVNCNAASRQSQFVAYSRTGLASGSHTIKVVKNSGTYMLLDAFAYTTSGSTPTYTITASAGANGSISPTGSVVVNQGANQAFAITPNAGYQVSGVTVDGSSVGAVTSYSFNNVQANHTISASFSASPNFTISATPSSQTVTAGNSASYTINIGSVNGFNGSVSFNVVGLPSGATASFNPASVTGSGTSTLMIATSSSVAAGTYSMTVTGTSGSLSHNTIVTLVVNSSGTTWTTVNDTDAGITYSAGWTYGGSRNLGDFQNDVHYTSGAGNYAQYTFTGTGVEFITETYSDEGNVDVYIDGVLQATVNCNTATRQSQAVVYANTSLAAGSHTIKVVKNSGTYMLVDAFAYTGASSGGGGALPAGWTDSDVGAVGIAGSAAYTNGTFTIQGSGADIWGTSDQFNYARENATNDFTMTARVTALSGVNAWAKSGVMVRGTASTNSAYVAVYVTKGNGISMQARISNSASAVDIGRQAGLVAPYWVRVVRSGNTFTGYSSADGATWSQVGSTNITMAASVRAGLAVTSHDNTQINTSTFDNVTVQ